MVGSGVSSAFIALFNAKAQALGAAGLPGIISIKPDSIAVYCIGMLISFVVTFALTLLLGLRAQRKAK
jgi:PTS system sucrose-specific IIC component